jgi:glycosyltransferase involved in cell wall biosynthesis
LGFARPFCFGIFDRLKRGAFDAVWVHGYSTVNSLQAIFSAGMLDVPVLLRAESTLHDRERSNLKMLAKEIFFLELRRHVRGVLAIGEANARYWRRYMGEDVPVYAMPYAVDNAFFQQKAAEAAPGTEALRQELGLEAGRPVILFVSKLQKRKRCADLLQAWLRLSASTAYLIIIGEGEERAELEKLALESPKAKSVRFLGFKNQTELPAYFVLCDVFVLPSVNEPWGLVVNEAMDAARAVVVSDDVGCQPDLVRDGVNGRVYPARDVDALTQALEDVLATPERARVMGAAGLEIIRRHGFEEDLAGLRHALGDVVPGFASSQAGAGAG